MVEPGGAAWREEGGGDSDDLSGKEDGGECELVMVCTPCMED